MTTAPDGMGERLAKLAGGRPWWPLVEPTPRWIRVRLGAELIADSCNALLQVQYGPGPLPRSFLPTYYLPMDDVVPGALVDPVEDDAGLTVWAVQTADQRADDAAWMHHAPSGPLASLAGMVTFTWREPMMWFEEDEPLLAHARDPHQRVDVVASSRAVQVARDGVILAESRQPLALFETTLPVRYYLPPADVRVELVPSRTRTVCPYKGVATWWAAQVGDELVEDIAWSYPSPVPENPRIAGLICFRNERVDLVVDGEQLERPVTPWS
ncbi:MAG TPA: DUF427 domain-containing protein [Jatrophihabitans sp.]|jgi:uncharacterized protein (DUF427 family)